MDTDKVIQVGRVLSSDFDSAKARANNPPDLDSFSYWLFVKLMLMLVGMRAFVLVKLVFYYNQIQGLFWLLVLLRCKMSIKV